MDGILARTHPEAPFLGPLALSGLSPSSDGKMFASLRSAENRGKSSGGPQKLRVIVIQRIKESHAPPFSRVSFPKVRKPKLHPSRHSRRQDESSPRRQTAVRRSPSQNVEGVKKKEDTMSTRTQQIEQEVETKAER